MNPTAWYRRRSVGMKKVALVKKSDLPGNLRFVNINTCQLAEFLHRFESREIAERVIEELHNVAGKNGHRLLLRFADTKAQKILKQQSNERRAYRAGEYNYSVEVIQGSTPSPATSRLENGQVSPLSFQSPVGVGPTWTPATTISPSYVTADTKDKEYANMTFRIPVVKNAGFRCGVQPFRVRPLANGENISAASRGRATSATPSALPDKITVISPSKTTVAATLTTPRTPTRKVPTLRKASSVSPSTSRKNIEKASPKSAAA